MPDDRATEPSAEAMAEAQSVYKRALDAGLDPPDLASTELPFWGLLQEIARALDAFAAQPVRRERCGWQPIEFAPKTFPNGGKPIDLWAGGRRYPACFQLEGHSGWWQVNPYGGPSAIPALG